MCWHWSRVDEGMSVMMASDSAGRRRARGTIGITIKVIEYDAATGTYQTVKSMAFAPKRDEPVSLVRPFVLASLGEIESDQGDGRPWRYDGGR